MNCASRRRPWWRGARRRLLAGLASLAALLAGAGPGSAAQQVTLEGVPFTAYEVGSSGENRARGRIVISCDADCPTAYTLTLGASLNGGSPAQRQMKHATKEKYLTYSVLLEGEGDTWAESVTRVFTAGTTLAVSVSGVIPPGQNVPAGAYSDRVTVSLEW